MDCSLWRWIHNSPSASGGLQKQIIYQHTLINTTSNEICSVANTKAQILWLEIAGATGWVFLWITEAFTNRVRFYSKALCLRKTLRVSCQPYVGYGFKVSMIFFLAWDKKIWLPEQYPQPISFASFFLMLFSSPIKILQFPKRTVNSTYYTLSLGFSWALLTAKWRSAAV